MRDLRAGHPHVEVADYRYTRDGFVAGITTTCAVDGQVWPCAVEVARRTREAIAAKS